MQFHDIVHCPRFFKFFELYGLIQIDAWCEEEEEHDFVSEWSVEALGRERNHQCLRQMLAYRRHHDHNHEERVGEMHLGLGSVGLGGFDRLK